MLNKLKKFLYSTKCDGTRTKINRMRYISLACNPLRIVRVHKGNYGHFCSFIRASLHVRLYHITQICLSYFVRPEYHRSWFVSGHLSRFLDFTFGIAPAWSSPTVAQMRSPYYFSIAIHPIHHSLLITNHNFFFTYLLHSSHQI